MQHWICNVFDAFQRWNSGFIFLLISHCLSIWYMHVLCFLLLIHPCSVWISFSKWFPGLCWFEINTSSSFVKECLLSYNITNSSFAWQDKSLVRWSSSMKTRFDTLRKLISWREDKRYILAGTWEDKRESSRFQVLLWLFKCWGTWSAGFYEDALNEDHHT